ncbi:predicted protein, partial [Nematostella vectensis]
AMADDPSQIFQMLRPICSEVSKGPTRSNVQTLEKLLKEQHGELLTKLSEYVLFPLKLTLQRQGVSDDLKHDVVRCMQTLISKIYICKFAIFEDVYTLLTVMLSLRESPGKSANISEEMKLSIITCLSALLDNTATVIKGLIYSTRFLPALGHGVSLLLDVSEHEKARNLKIEAIHCLQKLSFCKVEKSNSKSGGDELGDSKDEVEVYVREEAAKAFASFLPGIAMTICRIISGDPQQGHAVFISAINCFQNIIVLVLNDRNSKVKDESEITMNGHDKLQQLRVNTTKDWFNSTAEKLDLLLGKLCAAALSNSNWKVLLALANFCHCLLMNSHQTLQKSVPQLVEVLVGLGVDSFPQVAGESKSHLKEISTCVLSGGSFGALLEENLHSLLSSLPRLLRTADDTKKLRTLNLVHGYLNLLHGRLKTLLMSSSHLQRLSHAFLQVLEFEVSSVHIVEEKTLLMHKSAVLPSDTQGQDPFSIPVDNVMTTQFPKYYFKHFADDRIKSMVTSCCRLLGCHGDVPLLVDHFLELFQESKIHRKQCVLVLNDILLGTLDSQAREAVELLLSEYTSEKHWNLAISNAAFNANRTNTERGSMHQPISHTHLRTTGLSFEELNSNILLECLILEGLGTFARILGKQFQDFLIDVLYLILEKLGSDNATISRAAYGTLILICQSIGSRSLEALIACNADYLVNSISLDFKYIFINGRAPRVLQVMIQYSNSDILSIIDDTLSDTFAVMDVYPDEFMLSLVKVLHALVCALSRWFPDDFPKNKPSDTASKWKSGHSIMSHANAANASYADSLLNFVKEYKRKRQVAMGEVTEVTDEHPNNDAKEPDDITSDQEDKPPLHVHYAKKVLDKCVHIVSSRSLVVCLLVLDTIDESVRVIRHHENHLLPLIHKLWPPLVRRLKHQEEVVVVKAIEVVCGMAECSGDFMRRRVEKDVLPWLLQYLERQAAVSAKVSGAAYLHTKALKLQLAALHGLRRLCSQVEVGETELDRVCNTCTLYLSDRQPLVLQKACMAAFEAFITLDPDAVWLTLNQLYCPVEPNPPQNMFVRVSLGTTENKDLSENVTRLLKEFYQ